MSDPSRSVAGSLPLTMEEFLDTLCRRFERAWQAGQRPLVESYLAEAPPVVQAALLGELVALELTYRRRLNENPTLQEYHDRFPGQIEVFKRVFQEAEQAETCLDAPSSSSSAGHTSLKDTRYRPMRPHARGGLGEILIAEDLELHREVALKRIQSQHAQHSTSRHRFLREAEITARLEHPGIVPVYGLVLDSHGQPSYAMRFIRGETLQDAIARHHKEKGMRSGPTEDRLDLRGLLGRFVTVCNTIAYAHDQGVLHRDLKPGNIMIGKYGETLVVDWGLAKPISRAEGEGVPGRPIFPPLQLPDPATEATWAGAVAGTPAYMSPEQAAGQWDQVGPASDIYSLGATLYEILTNRPPREGGDVQAILNLARQGQFTPPRKVNRDVPPALEAVCLKAMALPARDRYATATDLARDVEHWLADEPLSVYQGTVVERIGRWARRHRTGVVAAMALVLATVLGTGVFAWQSEQARRRLQEEQTATEEARQEAEANAERERRAIRDYFVQTTEDPAWKAANLDPLRRKLLQQARDYFQSFIQKHGEKSALLAEMEEVHMRLGRVHIALGDRKQACLEFEAALELVERLATLHPEEVRYRSDRVKLWNAIAEQRRNLGDMTGARQDYERAYAFGEQLTRDHPGEPQYLGLLADIHSSQGELFKQLGETKAARLAYEEAVALSRRLVESHAHDPEYRAALAWNYNLMGVFLRSHQGDLAGARRAYEQALQTFEPLVKDHPGHTQYTHSLGMTLNNMAALLSHLQDMEGSLRFHRQSLEIHKRLARRHPSVPDYRQDLAMSHRNVGSCLYAQGDFKGARQAFEESLAIRERLVEDHGDIPEFRQDLGRIHAVLAVLFVNQKDAAAARHAYDKAQAIRQKLVADFPGVPAYRQELAASHSSLAGFLLRQDDRAGAIRNLGQTRALLEELATKYPDIPEYRRDLALALGNLGDNLREERKGGEARPCVERAVALWKELVDKHPGMDLYRERLEMTRQLLQQVENSIKTELK